MYHSLSALIAISAHLLQIVQAQNAITALTVCKTVQLLQSRVGWRTKNRLPTSMPSKGKDGRIHHGRNATTRLGRAELHVRALRQNQQSCADNPRDSANAGLVEFGRLRLRCDTVTRTGKGARR